MWFFDLLHDGHIDILRLAKQHCDYLIVAVGTDDFMIKRKHRTSVLSYEQRVKIVEAIKYVDMVVPEIDLNKIDAYELYHFNVMFSGEDHINEPAYVESTRILKEKGVETIYFPRKNNVSSTQIRKRIVKLNPLSVEKQNYKCTQDLKF